MQIVSKTKLAEEYLVIDDSGVYYEPELKEKLKELIKKYMDENWN